MAVSGQFDSHALVPKAVREPAFNMAARLSTEWTGQTQAWHPETSVHSVDRCNRTADAPVSDERALDHWRPLGRGFSEMED